MHVKKFYICAAVIILCSLFFVPGCKKDEDNNAYKGVSKLIAERHRARLAQSAEMKKKTSYTRSVTAPEDQCTMGETIHAEKAEIISSSSGKTIAKATVYLDNDGKIINIRIEKN